MSATFQHIQVIINPAAGRGQPILNTLNTVFAEHRIYWDVSITHGDWDGKPLAEEAVARGADLVAVYGGDGTIMEVANGLVGGDVPLAILPGGTGNVVAVELGIPRNLREATELLCSPLKRLRRIDVGNVGERFFLMRADIGATAKVAEQASRELKHRYGILAYFVSTFRTLQNPETVRYRINVDGIAIECDGIACLVANMAAVGALNLSLGTDVTPDDGLLDVFVVSRGLDTFFSAVTNIVADMVKIKELGASLVHTQGREVTIDVIPAQAARIDAEAFGTTPLRIAIVPRAIRVVVPPPL